MKKSILNLGKVLNKAEQKNVNGGSIICDPFLPPIYYDENNCEAYHALPNCQKKCVLVHYNCYSM